MITYGGPVPSSIDGDQSRLPLEPKGLALPKRKRKGATESIEKTADGSLAFANKRAEAWWKFREALDPDQPDGSAIALPPDPELRADLCTPTWKYTARGILLESKDDIRKRLGRSPGKGDAVVMCWSEGNAAAVSRHNAWKWEKYRDRRQRWIV